MRILMIAQRLPPAIGGVERHVAGLVRELHRGGDAVTLVAPSHAPGLPLEERLPEARVLRLPPGRSTRRGYLAAWRWWARHRRLLAEADLVHCHEVYALLHWLGPARLLCGRTPVYLTYHGYEMRYPIPRRARVYRRLAARLVRGSLCVGHFLVKWFDLPPQPVTYGAVTPPPAVPPLPAAPRAVFVGRLDADTGLDLYLRGLGALRRDHGRAVPLTVCGDGPRRAELETLARAEGVAATFLGMVADPTPRLAEASLAFVSGYLAMLEAMAYRRPVVAVYHTPIKEDYLRLVPGAEDLFAIAGGPDAVAAQVAALLDGRVDVGPRLDRAAAFARAHSWSRLADTYRALWGRT